MTPHAATITAIYRQTRRSVEEYQAHPSAANQPDRYYAGCAHCEKAKEEK